MERQLRGCHNGAVGDGDDSGERGRLTQPPSPTQKPPLPASFSTLEPLTEAPATGVSRDEEEGGDMVFKEKYRWINALRRGGRSGRLSEWSRLPVGLLVGVVPGHLCSPTRRICCRYERAKRWSKTKRTDHIPTGRICCWYGRIV